jgi:hypothetical protein
MCLRCTFTVLYGKKPIRSHDKETNTQHEVEDEVAVETSSGKKECADRKDDTDAISPFPLRTMRNADVWRTRLPSNSKGILPDYVTL